jgi:hypothetical protein
MRLRACLPVLVMFVMVLVFSSGCAGSASGTTTSAPGTTNTTLAPVTTSTVAEATSTTAARLAWGDTGTWQGASISAAQPQVDSVPESVDPGNKVVYCMIKLLNGSKDPFDYNGLDFTLFDTAHQEYDNFGLTSMPDLGVGTLPPGQSVQGTVAFEMPQSATPSGLEWQPQTADTPQLVWGQP